MQQFESILVSGGCGFIGSHFIRMALERWPRTRIINYDALTYAANPANLDDCSGHANYAFVHGDVRDGRQVLRVLQEHHCDAVVHLAAESHVDRSILDGDDTVTTNVIGTHVLLEAALKCRIRRFLYVSTDEVYGSIPDPLVADETWALQPNSPYAVAKAAGDLMARSYHVTFGLPSIITRACNTFGPNQFPEKLIPLFVSQLLEHKTVPLYGDGLNVRDWIYVTDHCTALARALEAGVAGESYNISGDARRTNREVVSCLLDHLDLDDSWICPVADRPGHDRRYAISSDKARSELGWQPRHTFEAALAHTIDWYRHNRQWWQPIKDGAFQTYYQQQYA